MNLTFLLSGAALLWAACIPLWAQDFPDGIWNGKPWDREALIQQAAKDDPAAMAEWVHCADRAELALPCNRDQMFDYATRAAAKGSVLGKLKQGEALIYGYGTKPDRLRGIKLVKEAAATGHPAAILELAVQRMIGPYKDKPKAAELWEQVKELDLHYAGFAEFNLNNSGALGYVDREDAFEALIQGFEDSRDIRIANTIYTEAFRKRGADSFLSKELIQQAKERLQEGAELGHDLAFHRLGYREIKSGNPHKGVPLMLKAAQAHNTSTLFSLTYWCRSPLYSGRLGAHIVAGDTRSAQHGAAHLYRNRFYTTDPHISRSYAERLAEEKFKAKTPRTLDDEAVTVFRDIIRRDRNDYRAWTGLAFYVGESDRGRNLDVEEATEHARNIFIYRSRGKDTMSHWLCWYYSMHTNKKRHDHVKGYAALQYAMSRNHADFLKTEQDWLKYSKKRLSPEQLKEAEKLVADGFPHARKYREAAFEYLKKKGDIPKDWAFDDDLDEVGEKEQSRLPQAGGIIPLMALLTHAPLSAVAAQDDPIQLLTKLAQGEDFEEEELTALTKVLLLESEDLLPLAKKVNLKFFHEVSVAVELQDAIMERVNPLQEQFFWFIECDSKGQFTSLPSMPDLTPGSIAETSGLKSGDVFESVYGVELRSLQSRNHFVRLLELWPKNEDLDLVVRRSKWNSHSLAYPNVRDITKSITVSFPEEEPAPEEE